MEPLYKTWPKRKIHHKFQLAIQINHVIFFSVLINICPSRFLVKQQHIEGGIGQPKSPSFASIIECHQLWVTAGVTFGIPFRPQRTAKHLCFNLLAYLNNAPWLYVWNQPRVWTLQTLLSVILENATDLEIAIALSPGVAWFKSLCKYFLCVEDTRPLQK